MKSKSLRHNEDGLISIITTLVMMSLLTLIAIGFANLANREQRQAIDQQLNTQAFYAAESGINEAIKNPSSFNSNNCNSQNIGSDPNISFTCVLVNTTLPTVKYPSGISPNDNVVVPITPAVTGEDLSTLTFSWENKDGMSVFVDDCEHRLMSSSDWGDRTGILRTMIFPANFANRAALVDNTQTIFMYPTSQASTSAAGCSSTGSTTTDFKQKGQFLDGGCVNGVTAAGFHKCSTDVNIAIPKGTTYYIRLKPIYKDLKITISGKAANGNAISFSGAQMEIDSTGKVADVLRRVQVQVPIFKGSRPDVQYATETSDTLCKRLFVYPGGANTDVNGIDGSTVQPYGSCVTQY